MNSVEDLSASLSKVHTELPVDEAVSTVSALQQLTGHLAATAQESSQLANLAEPLAAATDSVGHAAESLKTAQVSIATYLGSIGAEGGTTIPQQCSEQGTSEKSAEEVTLDAYNALTEKLKGGAKFDEQQSTQCLGEVMQTAQDLIRTGRLQEALKLRQKATYTYSVLPVLRYPSGMTHAEGWIRELEQLTLQLANAAKAQPGTAISHEIIDGILGGAGHLPMKDPGFAEFAAKNLAESIERAEKAVESSPNIEKLELQYDLANHYAANIIRILHFASPDASKEAAHIIAGFHGIGDSINLSLGGITLNKIASENRGALLRAFGFDPIQMREAWARANGGFENMGNTSYISKGEYMRRNLQTICRLEADHQGSARELQEMLRIHNFGRHDYEVLSDAYNLFEGDTLSTITGPIVVVASFAKDGNAAIIQTKDMHAKLHAQLKKKGGRLLPAEIQSREDPTTIRDNLIGLGMKKRIPMLVADSHGGIHSILTGGIRRDISDPPFNEITSDDIKQGLGDFAKGIVDRNGTIVLYGCENGKEAEGFAQVVADYTQRNVIASPEALGVRSLTVDVEPDGKINPTMVFFDDDTGKEVAPVHFKPRPKAQATE
ncbi:MAG TPA: hypothetical protein VMR45_02415 [Patescibacteria group bacterium]|nr:hypothetical protein [Patescibacteria group bacterium]